MEPDVETNVQSYKYIVETMTQDPDNDFIIFRRFKHLMLYKLTHQQARLINLEKKIKQYEDARKTTGGVKDSDMLQPLSQLDGLLNEYNMSLFLLSMNSKIKSPPSYLLDDITASFAKGRMRNLDFIKGKPYDELVAPLSKSKGRLHRFVDKSFLRRLFIQRTSPKTDEEKQQPSKAGIEMYSEKWVRRFEKVVVNIVFCILVLVPVGVLPRMTNLNYQILVICGSVLLTALLASGFSDRAHRSELSVMAAYTAILVVFLGNTLGRS